MKPKEIFWSGLKGGLFEQKHRKAMGEAVWLFGWLCMRQSQINPDGEGLPHYGNPLTFAEIAEDTGFPASTLRKWATVLTRTGYIHTRRTGNLGLVFFIHKAKSKAKSGKNSAKVTTETPPKLQTELQPQVRPDMDAPSAKVRPSLDGVPPKDGRTYANKSLKNEQVIENTNTLTPKHLSNYNTQESVSSLFKKAAKQLQPPRQMSQASLDERRRLLLRQSEEMQTKYGKAATA